MQNNYTVKSNDAINLVDRGEKIYDQGALSGRLYSLEFGCIMLSRVTISGGKQVVGFLFPGDTFGWEPNHEHTFSAEATEPSGVKVIRPGHVPQSPDWLVGEMTVSLARTREEILIVSLIKAEARVASFFYYLSSRQKRNNAIELPMQKLDIAYFLGLAPETISRVLRRFKEAGLISILSTHNIEILSWSGLEDT